MKFEEVLPQLRAGKMAMWHGQKIKLNESQFIVDEHGNLVDWLHAAIGTDLWSIIDDPVLSKAKELFTIFRIEANWYIDWNEISQDTRYGFLAIAKSVLG